MAFSLSGEKAFFRGINVEVKGSISPSHCNMISNPFPTYWHNPPNEQDVEFDLGTKN